MLTRLLSTACAMLALTACDDDEAMSPAETVTFEVRVENVSTVYDFAATGVFNTPVGAGAPAPIFPGEAYEFSFSAAPGSKLSFATMFVHSNDFFYAPGPEGIALFDGSGMAMSGDVTSQITLWDSGHEVNQEPGLGPDQAPRQAGPNTGAADADGTVRMAPDAFGNLPAASDVIEVTLTATGPTAFTLRIENVSDAMTLTTSDMATHAVPLAPGVWVVHTEDAPIFSSGMVDRGEGLEALAEDGEPSGLAATLAARTGLTSPLAPGAWAVHTSGDPMFTSGQADRGDGLEALAEDGDPSGLAAALVGASGVESSGAFNTPEGAAGPGPLFPGQSYVFEVSAAPGDRLSVATMLVQSNDLFYAPDGEGIALFTSGGSPISGDITAQYSLWDAGTEVNEEPGIGLNQAPRQSGPNTGPTENGTVRGVNDGYTYPAAASVIRITITPMQ